MASLLYLTLLVFSSLSLLGVTYLLKGPDSLLEDNLTSNSIGHVVIRPGSGLFLVHGILHRDAWAISIAIQGFITVTVFNNLIATILFLLVATSMMDYQETDRFLKYVPALRFISLCLLLLANFQSWSEFADNISNPPPGKLYLLNDGIKMHLHCEPKDMENKRMTVVFDAGLPFASPTWNKVFEEYRGDLGVQLCAFDRLGYAWSDAGSDPREVESMVKELKALVEAAQISSPYLLVGWSFGGLLAQLYTLKYKENVSGLVLIESSSIDEAESNWDLFQEGITSFDILRRVSPFGASRIAGALGLLPLESGFPTHDISEEFHKDMKFTVYKQQFANTAYKELLHFKDSENQVKQALLDLPGGLSDVPIVLVVTNKETEEDALKQVDYLKAKNYEILLVHDADHYIPMKQPQKVLEGLKKCIQRIQSSL